jgi:phosphomannomutase
MALAGPSAYKRQDVHFDAAAYPTQKERIMGALQDAQPSALAGTPVAKKTLLETNDGAKFFRADGSWLLIRLSGTEPLVRVYAETTDEKDLSPLIEEGEKMIGVKAAH